MNFKYEELLSVAFRHQYFGENKAYNGIAVQPSAATRAVLLNNGLVFKATHAGFIIGYDSFFAGQNRSREDVLKDNALLIFRLDLVDQQLYNYTGNLPGNISGLIFHFWNYNIRENTYRNTLQQHDLISSDDMDDLALIAKLKQEAAKNKADAGKITLLDNYFSKPFGQISIRLHSGLANTYELPFASLSTHWRYILRSSHFKELKDPAIIDKQNQPVFTGPANLVLPDRQPAIAFESVSPLPLTRLPQRKFKLVENFEKGNEHFKEVIRVLPDPDINLVSNITNGIPDSTEKKYSNIIL